MPVKRKSNSKRTKRSRKHFPFLDLPPELRNRIYAHLLVHPRGFIATENYPFRGTTIHQDCLYSSPHICLKPLNILLACKEINAEATPVLYGSNAFSIGSGSQSHFLNDIGTSRRFLREVSFGYAHHRDIFKNAFGLLKDAKRLDCLRLSLSCTQNFRKPSTLAKALTPLMKALHESRQGTDEKSAMDVLTFAAVEGDSLGDRDWKKFWENFEAETRAILESILE